ncbi:MAG: hypothetical protein VCA17_05690, partial [Dehalococcoidia bacterium]
MSVDEKAQVLQKVESSPGSKRKVLAGLGVSKSDCYRWRARARQGSLVDRRHPGPSWNRLSPQEESVALEVALGTPISPAGSWPRGSPSTKAFQSQNPPFNGSSIV